MTGHSLATVCAFAILLGPLLGDALEGSRRVVVTFHTAEMARQNYTVPNTTVAKQYGRRLILDFGREVNISADSEIITESIGSTNISTIEIDLVVSPQELNDGFVNVNVKESLDVLPIQNYTDMVFSTDNEFLLLDPDDTDDSPQNPPQKQSLPWNLASNENFSIRVETIWRELNVTEDNVIAVIDTGISEIAYPAFENLLPGFDFISDPSIALDGDGRDPNSSDPGSAGLNCPVSSWHGTKVSSIIAAKHETGIYGIAFNASILPIRVLGMCSQGYSNDVTDAIVWAAGGTINGIQTNPKPAKVISMSFSGTGLCPSYLQSAINQATSLGASLVVATGNGGQSSIENVFPANCRNVIAVGSRLRDGSEAPYSNKGGEAIFPGGDAKNPIPVLTIGVDSNLISSFSIGTSMAVPHASSILAYGLHINQRNSTIQNYFFDMTYKNNMSVSSQDCFNVGANCNSNPGHVVNEKLCQCVACTAGSMLPPGTTTYNKWFYVDIEGYGRGTYDNRFYNNNPVYAINNGQYLACTFANSLSNWVRFGDSILSYYWSPTHGACSSAGNWVDSVAALGKHGCFICGAGTGSPAGATECSVCQKGYYTPENGYGECVQCPAGKYNDALSSSVCHECENNCGSGSYRSGCGGSSAGTCTSCNCPVGEYYSDCGGFNRGTCNSCGACSTNEYRANCEGSNSGSCVTCVCEANKYMSGGCSGVTAHVCSPCPANTGRATSNTAPDIKTCLPFTGYYGNWGEAATQCSANFYCNGGDTNAVTKQTFQTACPSNTNSPVGSDERSDCTANAGYYGSPGFTPTLCTPNYYCPGGTARNGCPANTISAAGSDALADCIAKAGYYGPAGSAASNCSAGTYSAIGATVCTTCQDGTWSGVAASVCTQCAAGKAGRGAGKTSESDGCLDCAVGTFASSPGSADCTPCPAGTHLPSTGQLACYACPDGAYNTGSGLTVCLNCITGKYGNGPRLTSETAACSDCTVGKFAASAGSADCTLCGSGTYSSAARAVACTPCDTGTASTALGATSVCTGCATGKYANTPGANACLNCEAGKYASITGTVTCSLCEPGTAGTASGATSFCPNCVIGKYASGLGASLCTDCAAGSYISSTGVSVCNLCVIGTTSTATGSSSCTDCSAGTYNNVAGSTCVNCPDNTNSPQKSTSQTACVANAGYYGPAGGPVVACSGSNYCLAGATAQTPCTTCILGTSYQNKPCLTTQNRECTACTSPTCSAGQNFETCTLTQNAKCTDCSGILPLNAVWTALRNADLSCIWECDTNYYKTGSTCTLCSTDACLVGKYRSLCDKISGALCVSCTNKPANSRFTSNAPQGSDSCAWECNAGYYKVGSECRACSPRSYCGAGSTLDLPCPQDFYCAETWLKTQCTLGNYCPPGSTSETPCAAGAFCPDTHTQNQCNSGSYCPEGSKVELDCPAGSYCENPYTIATCDPGDYCPRRSQEKLKCELGSYCSLDTLIQTRCNSGYYCDVGVTQQTLCPAGFYCSTPSSKLPCGKGKYCLAGSTSAVNCPLGSYCVNTTTSQACTLGSYCTTSGLDQDIDCTAGSFCQTISTKGNCILGDYCPPRSTSRSDCPAGYYCSGPSSRTACYIEYYCDKRSTAPILCPAGSFCKNASVKEPCPLGTVCLERSTEPTKCPVGYYCPNTTSQIQCSAGSLCPAESTVETICPIGYFCPDFETKTQCTGGSYCAVPGLSQDLDCPAGFYCPTISQKIQCYLPDVCLARSMVKGTCEAGYYCSSSSSKVLCVPGDFCPAGATAPLDCEPMYYCPDTQTQKLCSGFGRYCPGRNTINTPCPAGFYCMAINAKQPCRTGYYCPEASMREEPCASGFFCANPSTQVACSLGSYCVVQYLTQEIDCPAGFFCKNIYTKESCLPGEYCPPRSTSRNECPSGYYCNTSLTSVACPVGHYCPRNSTLPIPCPAGFFADQPGRSTPCSPCAPLTYAANTGASTCTKCEIPGIVGQYRAGCGGNSSGTLQTCTGVP